MITISNIRRIVMAVAMVFCICSCNYLDIVPPETAQQKDMMIDNPTTLKYLYGCYGFIDNTNISGVLYNTIDGGGDDATVRPQEWEGAGSYAQYGYFTPVSAGTTNKYPWRDLYNAIGYCNEFLANLEKYNPSIDSNNRENYIAEVKFLKAYYHFRLMQLFGPIPIMDHLMSMNTPGSQFPGRSHFDYCVDYVVRLLDEAAYVLPPTYTNVDYFGRATSVIAKGLKARVLTYAASPLWNGSFPFIWSNKNFETPNYGVELVSREYQEKKWERAYIAAKEAVKAASDAGFELFNIQTSETLRNNHKVSLPIIPGEEEGSDFCKRVMMLRYMMTTRPDQGNNEILWGAQIAYPFTQASVPHYILISDQGDIRGYWGGLSPTLYTIEHFYTQKGLLPEKDPSFPAKSSWFESAELESNQNIVKLHVGREPRFYAWICFDGDEFSTYAKNQSSLIINAMDPQTQGYNPTLFGNRNYSVTGYLNKKWVAPNLYFSQVDGMDNWDRDAKYTASLMRLAELYLNLAECAAHLNKTDDVLFYLNEIRDRAGVPLLTSENIGNASLVDLVLQERFVELYQEGFRYHDIRRYLKGRERQSPQCYEGLNAMVVGPGFSEFNTRTRIAQPFNWNDRMYLLPIPQKDIYSNSQMEQAPGY